jgi:Adenylate and Guanylate cyclase catalytic domain/zinc-ribbon domain
MTVCPACGEPNPARASFCLACGASLPPPDVAVRPARKTVTVVFTDVADSAGLGARLDPESLALVMASWFEHIRALFERHGGRVQRFAGDAVVAVFGIPAVNEDVRSNLTADLAHVLHALGRGEEALRQARVSRGLAARDDLFAQVRWRGAAARALAADGRLEEAARLAGGAVTIAGPTDMLAMRGDALLDLAAVAAAAGRDGDAAEAACAALELYLAKGNLPGAARARVAVAAVRTRSASRAAADA